MAEVCEPFGVNVTDACAYVQRYYDACDSSGFASWTSWVVCESSDSTRIVLFGLGVLYLLYMLMWLGTATDDCLCTSITVIVEHLQISQNVAGVTFLAFGNGAVDIFSMLVEVVATDTPKADLAMGQMLGGSMFVLCVVIAIIVFHKPFKVMRRPIIRDLLFFIMSLGVLLVILLYDDRMYIWQPLMLLFIYVLYVLTVVFGSSLRTGKFLCFEWESRWASDAHVRPAVASAELNLGEMRADAKKSIGAVAPNSPPPLEGPTAIGAPLKALSPELLTVDCTPNTPQLRSYLRHASRRRGTLVPVGHEVDGIQLYRDHGRFFADERDANENDSEAPPQPLHKSALTPDSWSPSSERSDDTEGEKSDRILRRRVLRRCFPCLGDKFYFTFRKANAPAKFFLFFKIPIAVFLKMTTPLALVKWNKWRSLFHCYTSPLIILLAFGRLWAYSLALSSVAALLMAIFTSAKREPRGYKYIVTYVAFAVSIAWVYALAAECVNVVIMIGVVSRISHVILGLTLLAWGNSVGDLVADLAVARQGFSRMAISAAIGGPLLNLLIGFGLSFLVALLQGKTIEIPRGEYGKVIMAGFLIAALTLTLLMLPLQKFYATRVYAYALLALYVVFLVVVLANESGVRLSYAAPA